MANIDGLYKKAKELGITWIPNTIGGLEFAIEYMESQLPKKENGHNFNTVDRKCKKCGVKQLIWHLRKDEYKGGEEECHAYRIVSKRTGLDINEIIIDEKLHIKKR